PSAAAWRRPPFYSTSEANAQRRISRPKRGYPGLNPGHIWLDLGRPKLGPDASELDLCRAVQRVLTPQLQLFRRVTWTRSTTRHPSQGTASASSTSSTERAKRIQLPRLLSRIKACRLSLRYRLKSPTNRFVTHDLISAWLQFPAHPDARDSDVERRFLLGAASPIVALVATGRHRHPHPGFTPCL